MTLDLSLRILARSSRYFDNYFLVAMPVAMSTISSRTSVAGANPTVTVKLGGGMLPLNQKVLARLDQRNVAAHPWHDLEIGELQASVIRFSSLICKELVTFVMEKTLSSCLFTSSSRAYWNLYRRFHYVTISSTSICLGKVELEYLDLLFCMF